MVNIPNDHFGPIPAEADPRGTVRARARPAGRLLLLATSSCCPALLRHLPWLRPAAPWSPVRPAVLPASSCQPPTCSPRTAATNRRPLPCHARPRRRASAWASGGRTAWTAASGAHTSRTWRASPASPTSARSRWCSAAGAAWAGRGWGQQCGRQGQSVGEGEWPLLLLRPPSLLRLPATPRTTNQTCLQCHPFPLPSPACSYEDDRDEGEWFLYTGSGGRDLSGNKRTNKEQSFDQARAAGGRVAVGWPCGCCAAAARRSVASRTALHRPLPTSLPASTLPPAPLQCPLDRPLTA